MLRRSTKYTKTKKLLKADLTQKSSKRKYKTKYIDIKRYFSMINELVFKHDEECVQNLELEVNMR